MSETTHLALPFIAASQAQKHVTHNEALLRLDALLHLSVLTRSLSAPPDVPQEGARYLIAEAASGEWTDRAGDIAACQDGAWSFFKPRTGWRLWVEDEAALLIYTGAIWTALVADVITTPLLGISADADDYNRLVVSAPASLFNHAGAGHQLKLNKSQSPETASLLFQTGYSGRAEFGLAGDDHFHVKVSADGSSWHESIRIDNLSGLVSFPAGLASGGTQNLGAAITASPVTDCDNFDPDGWSGNGTDGAANLRLAPATSIRLTGLSGGTAARLALVANATAAAAAGARLIIIEHDSASSAAENRFSFSDRLPRLLMPGDTIPLFYDAEDSCWKEVTSQRFAAAFELFSDAYGINDFAISAFGASAAGQSGAYLAGDAVQHPRGICSLRTGTEVAGRVHWGSAPNAIVPARGCSLYLTRLAVETLSTASERFQVRAGWHDGHESSDSANGIYWEYDDSFSGAWNICTAAGGAVARTATEMPVDTGYVYLGIFLNGDWSRADFFSSPDCKSWSFHESLAGNLPSASQPVGFAVGIAKAVGVADRGLNIDLQAMRCDAPRGV